MSKKGAFIYQQIELTTAEWADNATVYPTSVWLFERLENGKFNMKLADGVHTFAQLPAVITYRPSRYSTFRPSPPKFALAGVSS